MVRELLIRVKTLTPLWTGSIDGTMDRIHETGIIGSLRWWYETIVRALGGWACEGPSGEKCELSGKKFESFKEARKKGKDWWTALDEVGICDACKIFGTTGWKRRIRLEVIDDQTEPIWHPYDRMLNVRPLGRKRGWFLPPGRMGKFKLKLSGDPKALEVLSGLFLFLERWGSLGAKSQLGYGIFKIENHKEVAEKVQQVYWKEVKIKNNNEVTDLPNLKQFGFLRYRIVNPHPAWWTHVSGIERVAALVQPLVSKHKIVPVMPSLKNEWRFNQWKGPKQLESEIFGSSYPQRKKSKIAISWAYQVFDNTWEIRVWVWFSSLDYMNNLWKMLTDLKTWEKAISTKGKLSSYRYMSTKEIISLLQGGI